MKPILLAGIIMVVLGAAALGYDYTYTTRETVLQIGPIVATADKTRTVAFPAIVGWLLIAGGIACFIGHGMSSRKS
jgi:hypothetical protein